VDNPLVIHIKIGAKWREIAMYTIQVASIYGG